MRPTGPNSKVKNIAAFNLLDLPLLNLLAFAETINKAEELAKLASEADQLREELAKLRDINKSQAEALETAK